MCYFEQILNGKFKIFNLQLLILHHQGHYFFAKFLYKFKLNFFKLKYVYDYIFTIDLKQLCLSGQYFELIYFKN